ncbi:MAG TPA: hypothetical protein VEU76_08905 [Candidatus Udaeobacter sp.]|nr:hypothetical protein [Candidatus Udaeobacter sp.]
MAHLNDGTLRRMVDDPDARAGSDGAHLEACPECSSRLKAFSDDARSIATLLAVPETHVDVPAAFDRVLHTPQSKPAFGMRLPLVRPFAGPLKLALVAAVMAAALVVVAFAANGFFYKPTTVQAVPITAVDVQSLSQLAKYGTFTWTKQPKLTAATNAADASTAAGIKAPTAGWLPSTVSSTVTYGAITDAQATFTFSAAKASAAAASQGATAPPMPAGLDGAIVTISAGPAVGIVYGDINQPANVTDPSQINLPQLVILKSTTPTVKSDTVSLDVLESYLLQQPGLTTDLKNAVEAITDPSSTLLIPVPVNYVSSSQYTVTGPDGGNGVALGDNTGVGSGVVWISSDGYVYAVVGSVRQQDAEQIADNLK